MSSFNFLPNEILDKVMDYVASGEPRTLFPFLLSRQLYPSAQQAIRQHILLSLFSRKEAEDLARWLAKTVKKTKLAKKSVLIGVIHKEIRHHITPLILVGDTMRQSPHIFLYTRSVTLSLFDTQPNHQVRQAFDSIISAAWDEGVAGICAAARQMERCSIDWVDKMPSTSLQITQLSNLRSLSLRGRSPKARLLCSIEVPGRVEELHLDNLRLEVTRVSQLVKHSGNTATESIESEYSENRSSGSKSIVLFVTDCSSINYYRDDYFPTGTQLISPSLPRYTRARIENTVGRLYQNSLVMLSNSHETLLSLEFLDCSCPCGGAREHWAREWYTYFRRFVNLDRLKVPYWNMMNLEIKTEYHFLLKLTHLEICITEAELLGFLHTFTNRLYSIQEGNFFPQLAVIKLSRREFHHPVKGMAQENRWIIFRDWVEWAWNHESRQDFCGWTKPLKQTKDNATTKAGIYKWHCGIEFDVSEIFGYVDTLTPKTKPVEALRLDEDGSYRTVIEVLSNL